MKLQKNWYRICFSDDYDGDDKISHLVSLID